MALKPFKELFDLDLSKEVAKRPVKEKLKYDSRLFRMGQLH